MRLASARPRRKVAAVAVVAVAAGFFTHGIASAQAPSSPQLPDFGSTSGPYQDSVQKFGFQVVTGGFSAGTPLTFRFRFNQAVGDRSHAVTFGAQQSKLATPYVTQYEVPSGSVPVAGCVGVGHLVNAVTANPYTQTITVVPETSESAGQAVVFCFNSLVGFPQTVADGYAIDYTEPGGTVSQTYSVLAQQNIPPASQSTEMVSLYDGTTDVTGTGVGGSPLGVYDVSYRVVITGDKNGTYNFGANAFDSVSFEADTGAKAAVTGTSSALTNPACTPMTATVCTDANGQGTATLTVSSANPNPDYVVVGGARQKIGPAQTSDEKVGSLVSMSMGPSGATLPTPAPTQWHTPPSGPGGSTPASTFNPECPRADYVSRGVGSREVFDEAAQVLLPAASVMCQAVGRLVSYLGLNDTAGLKAVFSDYNSIYAFAGTDRPLTSAEEKDYAPGGANTISQIPISVEPVVVTYNLDGCRVGSVTLRSQVLSLILMGKITSWDDTLLQQDNHGSLANCHLPILVAHDIGVTSSILKDYLSKRNSQWTAYRAPQLSQAWPGSSPVSCTANGSRPMALCVAGRPGTLGYGFYRDIVDAGLPVAQVDGPAGAWDNKNSILDGCTAAAGDQTAPNPFALMPPTASGDWGNTSLTDTAQPGAYPICSFDFIVAPTGCRYSHMIVNYHALVSFLEAVTSDYIQEKLPSHRFAKLPPSLQAFSTAGAKLLTCP